MNFYLNAGPIAKPRQNATSPNEENNSDNFERLKFIIFIRDFKNRVADSVLFLK